MTTTSLSDLIGQRFSREHPELSGQPLQGRFVVDWLLAQAEKPHILKILSAASDLSKPQHHDTLICYFDDHSAWVVGPRQLTDEETTHYYKLALEKEYQNDMAMVAFLLSLLSPSDPRRPEADSVRDPDATLH
jgi:hypothetical protein